MLPKIMVITSTLYAYCVCIVHSKKGLDQNIAKSQLARSIIPNIRSHTKLRKKHSVVMNNEMHKNRRSHYASVFCVSVYANPLFSCSMARAETSFIDFIGICIVLLSCAYGQPLSKRIRNHTIWCIYIYCLLIGDVCEYLRNCDRNSKDKVVDYGERKLRS